MLNERFWSKVNKVEGGCWTWTAYMQHGYGRFSMNSKPTSAHRLSYIYSKGVIPEGMTLDHLCRNRACVNPDHLEIVSRGENVLRGISPSAQHARNTTCPKGHSYDGINSRGDRFCRSCKRLAERLRHHKHKDSKNEKRRNAYKALKALAAAEKGA